MGAQAPVRREMTPEIMAAAQANRACAARRNFEQEAHAAKHQARKAPVAESGSSTDSEAAQPAAEAGASRKRKASDAGISHEIGDKLADAKRVRFHDRLMEKAKKGKRNASF
jgi:hypothetical protein